MTISCMYFSAQDAANENDGVNDDNAPLTEAEVTLAGFWPTISDEIKRIKTVDAKNQVLPLARIKKIMKLDEDVKMISAEAPLLFAKAAEIFIHELTLRAWVHTENNKRRTLQRNDIAMAISKFDQFDFLIDIVPREEIKPVRKETTATTMTTNAVAGTAVATPTKTNCDQVQYYLQLAQQHQQALQNTNNLTATPTAMTNTNTLNAPTLQNAIQLSTGQLAPITTINANGHPQNILVTNTGQQISSVGGVVNNLGMDFDCSSFSLSTFISHDDFFPCAISGGLQAAHHQAQPPIQLLQQIVTPNGEIQHMPVSFQLKIDFIQ